MTKKTDENIVFINAKQSLNKDVEPLLSMLQRYFNNITTLIGSDHSDILDKIKKLKNEIDVIIIDHEVYKGIKLLENILYIDTKFHILIVSGSAHCSEIRGCDYCKEHYNKIRIMTPVNKKELIDCIRNFENHTCEYEKKCEEIKDGSCLY